MTRRLSAWLEGVYAGEFIEDERAGSITFLYDDNAPQTPISLSLPRDGAATRKAAGRFLGNLLPDRQAAREWMKSVTHAASTGTFDLLAAVGGDLAGGLVLLPGDETPEAAIGDLDPAEDDAIAFRIRTLHLDTDRWYDSAEPARFSLAGSQPKFALADIDGDWYWSNAAIPSTHIVKPAANVNVGAEEAEVAAIALAGLVGIAAPRASILTIAGEQAYIVERFDRVTGADSIARRVHVEDMAQALGKDTSEKYDVTARQVIELLAAHDADLRSGYDFVRQMAFNSAIGNADAHAKNYSVLLRPESISLAPIYDSLPTRLWPSYDQTLAMRVSGADFPQEVSIDHWAKLARTSGLDQDRVVEEVRVIYQAVADRADTAWADLPDDQPARMRDLIREQTGKIAR